MATQPAAERRKLPWYRFPGTWVIVVGHLQALIGYTWIVYVWTVFIRLFMEEFKWSAAMVGGLGSMGRITAVWANPLGGWTADWWGPRYSTAIWLTILSLGWVALAFMTEYWQPYIIYGVILYGGMSGGLYRISYTAANRWWMDRRAMAIGAVTLGGGIGSVFGLPLGTLAITAWGWRAGAYIAAASTFILGVPVAWIYPNHMPERYGLYPDNLSPEERRERAERAAARRGARAVMRPMLADIGVRQALRSFTFWMLVISGGAMMIGAAPLSLFQNYRMGALGYSVQAAANFYSLNNTMAFVGRLAATFGGDWLSARLPVRIGMSVTYVLMGIGLAIFGFASNDLGFYAWAVVYGLFMGVSVVYYPNLIGAYFGRQAFGTIYGLRIGIASSCGIASPTVLGMLADLYGWGIPFYSAGTAYIIGGLLLLLAVPPKEQARERAISAA